MGLFVITQNGNNGSFVRLNERLSNLLTDRNLRIQAGKTLVPKHKF
jgi:hypothetical protein